MSDNAQLSNKRKALIAQQGDTYRRNRQQLGLAKAMAIKGRKFGNKSVFKAVKNRPFEEFVLPRLSLHVVEDAMALEEAAAPAEVLYQ